MATARKAAPHAAPGKALMPAAAAVRAELVTAGVPECDVTVAGSVVSLVDSSVDEGATVLDATVEEDIVKGVGTGTDWTAELVVVTGGFPCVGGGAADVMTETWHCVFMTTVQ